MCNRFLKIYCVLVLNLKICTSNQGEKVSNEIWGKISTEPIKTTSKHKNIICNVSLKHENHIKNENEVSITNKNTITYNYKDTTNYKSIFTSMPLQKTLKYPNNYNKPSIDSKDEIHSNRKLQIRQVSDETVIGLNDSKPEDIINVIGLKPERSSLANNADTEKKSTLENNDNNYITIAPDTTTITKNDYNLPNTLIYYVEIATNYKEEDNNYSTIVYDNNEELLLRQDTTLETTETEDPNSTALFKPTEFVPNFEKEPTVHPNFTRNLDYDTDFNILVPTKKITTTESTNVTINITTTSTTTELTTTPEIVPLTTPAGPHLDIPALLKIISDLVYYYDTNLTLWVNETLQHRKIPTCQTPSTTHKTFDYEVNETRDSELVAKCFVCGLVERGIPYSAQCADAFSGDFIPLVPVNPTAKANLARFRKYCKYKNVWGVFYNRSDRKAIYGRWTGGCAVRWADVSGVYTQRTCRNRNRAQLGRHFASKRMARLEMALRDKENGCIISPMAVLTPLSRGISLFARYHACVCSGNWCNMAISSQEITFYILTLIVTVICIISIKQT